MRLVCPSTDDEARARAAALAERFGLELVMDEGAAASGSVEGEDAGPAFLRLEGAAAGSLVMVAPDPHDPSRMTTLRPELAAFAQRLAKRPPSRKDAFARAVGKSPECVLDATAGYGHDAMLLAALGFRVIAIERHAGLAALLADQLDAVFARGAGEGAGGVAVMEAAERITLVHADAREALERLAAGKGPDWSAGRGIDAAEAFGAPDAVYIDPMYPPRRKSSARPRKRLDIARALLGPNDAVDAPALLESALRALAAISSHPRDDSDAPPPRRVIVKRPHDAQPIAEPSFTLESKLIRYDVHVVDA